MGAQRTSTNGLREQRGTMVKSNRLAVLADEINRAHKVANEAARTSLESAIEAGERLIESKALVKHGEWLLWLNELCDLSERTAQVYMRLARHKDVTGAKSATAADLTMSIAIAEITEAKWPDKVSEKVEAARHLPLIGHIRIGVHENTACRDARWNEVWIAPSYQHNGFCYVTHIWTARAGDATMDGTKKPVRADFVSTLINEYLSCDLDGMAWHDIPYPPWTYNLLIFENVADAYINTFGFHNEKAIKDLAEITEAKAPSPDPAHVETATITGPGPFCAPLIDGLAAGATT